MNDENSLREEAIAGLSASQARLPTRLLYDELGSHLFDAITLLPEYGLTRTEQAMLDAHAGELSTHFGPGPHLMELGCGCCRKAETLFAALSPSSYLGIDISGDYLNRVLGELRERHPQVLIRGHVSDFSRQLQLPDDLPPTPRQVLYLGSSLGNFTRPEAIRLIREGLEASHGGSLLLGLDLMRNDDDLLDAYDDAIGVTAAFNLNILLATNRLVGSRFRPRSFQHRVLVNHEEQRVELYLEAREEELVSWPGGQRVFSPGDRILTEYSHKYTTTSIAEMVKSAGGRLDHAWTSAAGDYQLALIRCS